MPRPVIFNALVGCFYQQAQSRPKEQQAKSRSQGPCFWLLAITPTTAGLGLFSSPDGFGDNTNNGQINRVRISVSAAARDPSDEEKQKAGSQAETGLLQGRINLYHFRNGVWRPVFAA
jgi:hypothetical protein